MDIQDLIRAKREQIALLERHIKALEEMAAEEGSISTGSTIRAAGRGRRRAPGRRRGRRGDSRAGMIEKYLKSHSGPQPAKEIAAALGLKAGEVHGAIHSGLKGGRFVRGKERATYGLGSDGASAPTRKSSKKTRTRRTSKKRATRKARAKSASAKPASEASQAST